MNGFTRNIGVDEKYCSSCGKVILTKVTFCPYCGALAAGIKTNEASASPKSRTAILLLCYFFGWFGIHRFYAGKIGTGIIWFLTFGVFGIGNMIDMIFIIIGRFQDSDGKYIENWDLK